MRTPQGRALVDRHRTAQATLSKATIKQMLSLWPLLTTGGVTPESQRRWIQAALLVLAARRRESAGLALAFSRAYRVAEGVEDVFEPRAALTLPVEAVTTSLSVLGPVAYRREVGRQLGKDAREVTDLDLRNTRLPGGLEQKLNANAARAAQRHVQNGARETLDDVATRDRRVVGYMRVTDASPCWFCAMLASRGPVYQGDSFEESNARFNGPGDQKVHDSCGCMIIPMYSRMESPEELQSLTRYREYDRLWREHPSRLDFRRAFEGRSTSA